MLNTKPYTTKLQNKMKATSKFIMAATLVMVVTLAIVLGLILVLLAELYCSLLLHRRHLRKKPNSNTTIPTSATPSTTTISKLPPLLTPHSPPSPPSPPPPPFVSAYSQGVLQAPRSFLFPCKDEQNPTPRGIDLVSLSSPSPLASFLARAPPPQSLQPAADEKPCGGGVEHLVYISNPIYENELEAKASRVNTPFETPNTSPSRLSGSSGEDDDRNGGGSCGCSHLPPSLTPPLTPMKKLPAEGSSVSLRDATSLGTSGSDTHSINGPSSSSSSSSDTPSTSPSW